MEVSPTKDSEKFKFPKKVGIVFLERRKRVVEVDTQMPTLRKEKDELSLNFDQNACAFFLLQLNQYQNIFEFQVIDIPIPEEEDKISLIPRGNDKEDLLGWVHRFALDNSDLSINYWIGITSELVSDKPTWHFDGREIKDIKSHKILWIISSKDWEEYRSPPSLFEYLLTTVFRCALQSLNMELGGVRHFLRNKNHKVTRGCIFDFTHRRESVSIFKLCSGCKNELSLLENTIKDGNNYVNLVGNVNNILSKEWMGSPEKRDSPLYDLKKIYKYDVDRNSGFKKGLWEKLRDSVTDNLAQWTVGTAVTGLIGIILVIIFKQ
jgi:hypothetical protein